MSQGRSRELVEALNQEDAVATSSLGGFGNESLLRIFSNVIFKFYNFIRKQKGGWREPEILGEESLKPA